MDRQSGPQVARRGPEVQHRTSVEPLAICEYRWQSEVLFPPQALFIVQEIKTKWCNVTNESITWKPTHPDPFCPVTRQEDGGQKPNWICTDGPFDGFKEVHIAQVEELTKDIGYDWVDGSDPIEGVEQECDDCKFGGMKSWIWCLIVGVVMLAIGVVIGILIGRACWKPAGDGASP